MKQTIERRKPKGLLDYVALAITTFGVGYLPLAPGTWGSAVGVLIYLAVSDLAFILYSPDTFIVGEKSHLYHPELSALISAGMVLLGLVGIWGSTRSVPLLGNADPSEAVIDEVMGQLVVFLFIPFGPGWPFILAGFLLFRLFDIWKPYPIRNLEILPGGLGICADDILAGVYAGICLAVIYAVSLSV